LSFKPAGTESIFIGQQSETGGLQR